MSKRAR